MFNNSEGEPVGWVLYSVDSATRGCHVTFMGTKDKESGYGSAIIRSLQSRFDSIGLTDDAYITEDLAKKFGSDRLQERLRKFYAKNGFYKVTTGFSWARNHPNMETAQAGEEWEIEDFLIANGENYSRGTLLETYFLKLSEQGVLKDVFTEKEQRAVESWLALRRAYRDTSKNIQKLEIEQIIDNARLDQEEHEKFMATSK